MKIRTKTSRLKRILLGMGCLAVAYQLFGLGRLPNLLMDDFIAYWAAGRLQVTGRNPYSFELFSELQKSIGWQERPHVMLYPPWAFVLLMPLGAPDYVPARLTWLLLNIGLLAASSTLLWRLYHGVPSLIGLAWLVTFLFYPSLYLLRMGQMGLVVLFGLVCFLRLQEKGKHWQSGMVLLLPAIKPHLVYLFWIALALWIFQERRWKLLGGIVMVLLVATAVPMIFNSHLLAQSSSVWGHAQTPLFEYDTPTLGTILRKVFGWEKHWLQFLPMALCTVGLLWHWRKRRHAWDWGRELPLLLAVSVLTCLYSWVSDLILFLPVVMQTVVLILRLPSTRRQIGMISLLGISVFCVVINLLGATDFTYFWLGPALLVCYWTLQQSTSQVELNAV